MKRVGLHLLLVFAIAAGLSCSKKDEKAVAGRDVVLYSSVDQPYLAPLMKQFEERTGIHVRLVTDEEATKSAGLAERIEAEKDNPHADVYWGNEIFHAIRLAEAGAFAAYRSPAGAGIPAKWRDGQDRFVDVGLRVRMLAVSTRAENQALAANVKGIEDLVRPELKDRVGMSFPAFGTASGHVAALYVTMGPERFGVLLQALKANGIKLLGGNSVVADQVASGNLVAGLTDNDDLANAKADGQKIDGVLPDQNGRGTLLVPTTVALVKGGPHGEAGKKLIDFLLDPGVEKQLIDAKFLAYSTRAAEPAVKGMDVDYVELSKQMPAAVKMTLDILQDRGGEVMKFALSTAGRGLRDSLVLVKELGFDGVELDGLPDDVATAREAGVSIACFCSSMAYAGNKNDDLVSGGVIQADIDAAARMGCGMVRVLDMARPGDATRFGDFLLPLADYAAERNVTLVVENALTLRTARAMWIMLDRLRHPALGVCWNVASAAAVGETPYQSVPLLNSLIRHVRVTGSEVGELERSLITRLRGVGYGGFISLANGDGLARLREWAKPAAKGKVTALKPA